MAALADDPDCLILVDDDADVLTAMRFAFETYGYRVSTYRSAEDLLAAPAPDLCACIVIDYRLPGVTGLDAVLSLRERGVDAPAILITSYPSAATRTRAAAASIEIVEKPLLGDLLVHKVRAMFDAHAPSRPSA